MDSYACALVYFLSVSTLSVHGRDLGQVCSAPRDCTRNNLIECRDGHCACVNGHMQNRSSEYAKEECVQLIVPTKTHGESCNWGQCLGEFVCKNAHCACPFHHPGYNAQTQACEKSGRNEPCLNCLGTEPTGPCHSGRGRDSEGLLWTDTNDDRDLIGCKMDGNFDCDIDKCKCDRDFLNYHGPSKRCEKGYSGEDCHNNDGCHDYFLGQPYSGTLFCDAGKCTCRDGVPMWDVGTRECRKYLHGEQCTEDFFCDTSKGLKCENGHCACAPGYSILDDLTKTCKKAYKDPCSDDDECMHSQGVKCVNSVCACPNQSAYNGTYCVSTKLPGGEQCFENGVWEDKLCESGVCVGEDTHQVDLEGRCACANGSSTGGFNYFFSPFAKNRHPGCFPDYNGRPCTGNQDCVPRDFDPGQNGPVCKNSGGGKCTCDKANYVFFLGRCVEADRTHDDSCDPYGVDQSMCKIDPPIALVCRKDGVGNWKCECQKMGMNSTDGKTIFVDLSWNATAQKCELEMKKEGMMRKANGECQSGECDPSGSAAKCAPMPGAGIQIQSGKILIIVITVILTILH